MSLPDGGNRFSTTSFTALGSYQNSERYYVMPAEVSLNKQSKQPSNIALNYLYVGNSQTPESSLYAMLKLELTRHTPLQPAIEYIRESHPRSVVTPISVSPKAYWHLELAEQKPLVQSFAWEEAETAIIYQRLPNSVANLLYGGLLNNRLLAQVAIELEIAALVPRFPAKVSFNTRKLLAALSGLNDSTQQISLHKLQEKLITQLESLPLTIQSDESVRLTHPPAFTAALIGHIRMFLARNVPSSLIATGPCIQLNTIDTIPSSSETTVWDFRTPLLASFYYLYRFDPFASVMKDVTTAGIDKIVSFTNIPPLPKDLLSERIYINVSLPPNLSNVARVKVDLRVEPQFAPHRSAQLKTFWIYPHKADSPYVTLTFRHPKQKRYTFQVTTITQSGERITSQKQEHTGDYLFIGSEFLPDFLTIRASDQLLGAGTVKLTFSTGREAEKEALAPITLSRSQAAVSYTLSPQTKTDMTITATCISQANKTDQVTTTLMAETTTLTPFSYKEFSAHHIPVTVVFEQRSQMIVLQFSGEGQEEANPTLLLFSPQQPDHSFKYTPTDLFQYRYRYRPQISDSLYGDWSPYQLPTEPLVIQANALAA